MKKIFCDTLKRLRGNASQSSIALKLRVKQATYSRWEAGQREPSFEDIEKILSHFGITPNELFGYDSPVQNQPVFRTEQPKEENNTETTELRIENRLLREEIERLHSTIVAITSDVPVKKDTPQQQGGNIATGA